MQSEISAGIRIKSIQLTNIGCFHELSLDFSSKFNVICGANGVGKSTILSALGRGFSRHNSSLRRRADSSAEGTWKAQIVTPSGEMEARGQTRGLLPKDNDEASGSFAPFAHFLLFFKGGRDLLYSQLGAISADPAINQNQWSQDAVSGIDTHDIKRWLANRFLFAPHPNSLSARELADFEFAKQCFSILDPKVLFDSVEASTFDIFVSVPQGRIPFEYLSSGYKASLALMLGIIREVEVRGETVPAAEFRGVVLIDELDLHLHPTWQREIVRALRQAFPMVQFIVTTHSPHIIQNAEPHEVIALVSNDGGNPRRLNVMPGRFGFKGWTLEEILRDVMGLSDTNSTEYRKAIRAFDAAIDSDNNAGVVHALSDLDEMLHPSNHLRQLLRLQAAPLIGDLDD